MFATNSWQPKNVNLWYFQLLSFDLTELVVWKVKVFEFVFVKYTDSSDISK